MKKSHFSGLVIFLALFLFGACTQKPAQKETDIKTETVATEESEMHQAMNVPEDDRISLNLLPKQKRHQLINMRSHLVAVQTIIELISTDSLELASKVAHTELGSTTKMKLMCASFGNEDFEKLGLSFHASADDLSETLKTGDKKKSLEALAVTMNYCITCHANYRQ
ncbi:MAG TPA: cytochrome C [Saprospiraceae bacterium]|nr:cytochrome C [Saprospiraceae bacterium]